MKLSKLSKLSLPVLMLACAPAAFARHAAAAPTSAPTSAPIHATITMRDPAALEVSYQIPPSCTALDFRNDGMQPETVAGLRSDWRAADDCTEFDGRQIRRKNPSCSTLRLRVPATTRPADRVYPWAYPVEQGLYVHTGVYALTEACGAVDWQFVVPGGTVVVDGVMTQESGARSAAAGDGDWMPAVLIQQTFAPGAAPRIHASKAFTPETMAFIDRTLASIEREFRTELPGLPFSLPFIVASPSDRAGNHWGDVANGTVMRLAFWPAPGPEQEAVLHGFVTHEMAHLTQPRNMDDSWKDDEATIHEGGAEFLRVVTAARLGWTDRTALKDDLERAVNSCLIAAEGKSWKAMEGRGWGRNPYDCGLTFYAIGLSSTMASTTPLLRMRDYHVKANKGERTDFARALECGAARDCQPRWLPRLAGTESLESVLTEYARQPGSLLRTTSEWNPALVKATAHRHVAQLMRADCKGAVSMYKEPAAARIAPGPACGVLREGMVVVRAEGMPLFENANALKASVKACHDKGSTVLGLQDGRSVTLACDAASVSVPAQVFGVDPDRAQALLR
jgi:hypothetical protein